MIKLNGRRILLIYKPLFANRSQSVSTSCRHKTYSFLIFEQRDDQDGWSSTIDLSWASSNNSTKDADTKFIRCCVLGRGMAKLTDTISSIDLPSCPSVYDTKLIKLTNLHKKFRKKTQQMEKVSPQLRTAQKKSEELRSLLRIWFD